MAVSVAWGVPTHSRTCAALAHLVGGPEAASDVEPRVVAAHDDDAVRPEP
jgi:hypothetical protein